MFDCLALACQEGATVKGFVTGGGGFEPWQGLVLIEEMLGLTTLLCYEVTITDLILTCEHSGTEPTEPQAGFEHLFLIRI